MARPCRAVLSLETLGDFSVHKNSYGNPMKSMAFPRKNNDIKRQVTLKMMEVGPFTAMEDMERSKNGWVFPSQPISWRIFDAI